MIGASLYIIVCSVRNRVVRRLRRLREPRYLLGAIVGAAYLYFSVFARMFGSRARAGPRGRPDLESDDLALPALAALGPAVGGLALFAVAAVCWILPVDASLLDFSEAEVQFLFPAPVNRRQLIIHRLLRSQIGLLFASLVPALLYPSATMWMRLRTALAMWVLLVAGKVYFTGVTMARGHLRSSNPASRRAAWTPIVVVLAAVAVLGERLVSAFWRRPGADGLEVVSRLADVTKTGVASVASWPFVALATPLFAGSFSLFAAAVPLSCAVLVATVWWVLHSDEVFQADVTEMAARQREPRAGSAPALRARAAGWKLAATGRVEEVFFWKNGMQTLRGTSLFVVLRYVGPVLWLVVVAVAIRMSSTDSRDLAAGFGTFAVFAAGFAVLFGPQMVRTDLRSDLRHLELLKTWPVRPAEVVRGEMLWPGTTVTAMGWFALLCAAVFSAAAFPRWPLTWRLSTTAGAILLAPALVFAQYSVHAAAAVLFPAWVPLGEQRARGLDAMGQRLIMFAGVLLTLVVVVGPGAIAGAILWLLLYRVIGAAVVVLGAAVCLAIVVIEVWLVTEALGKAFERVDLSGIERGE